MYQARLRRALEQGNIKPDDTADSTDFTPVPPRASEQMTIAGEGLVEARKQLRGTRIRASYAV